jgi:glycosyltransferase involved in cell wall biosynthesis
LIVNHITRWELLAKLVYAHDGISTYDELFLNALMEKYDTYVLTFHHSPTCIPSGIKTVKMREVIPETNLHPFEGMRKHLLTLMRARTLKKNLIRIKPDVLIGCWASTYGFYSAYSNFHPFMLFIWGSDVLVFPRKYFPLKPLVTYSIKKADVVVVDSDVQKEAAIELGCARQKIVKFPWVSLNGFSRNQKQRAKIRKEFRWSDDDVVVISLRHHKSIYGVEYLINAIPYMLNENKSIKFLILGEGPLTEIFKLRVDKFIKSGEVKFIGTVPHENIADYLSAADIYVSTSFSDGASASLLEAMACSLTPVVTEINGNKEWIRDGMNGLLVPVANSKSIAEKILMLASNHKLRKTLQVKAEETVRTRVTWNKNIDELTKIIDKVIHI